MRQCLELFQRQERPAFRATDGLAQQADNRIRRLRIVRINRIDGFDQVIERQNPPDRRLHERELKPEIRNGRRTSARKLIGE